MLFTFIVLFCVGIDGAPELFRSGSTFSDLQKVVKPSDTRLEWIKQMKMNIKNSLKYTMTSEDSSVIPLESWSSCHSNNSLCISISSQNLRNITSFRIYFWKSYFIGEEHTTFYLKQNNTILFERSVQNVYEGWIYLDVDFNEDDHYTNPVTTFVIETNEKRRSFDFKFQPFIVTGLLLSKRKKRSIDWCQPNRRNCCRESLYVSFKELGWDKWVLEPKGFTMYFCGGECDRITREEIDEAGNTYLGLLMEISPPQRLLMDNKRQVPEMLRKKLTPCCTATKKSSLRVLLIEYGKHTSIRLASLTDLIVKECGCVG